MQKFGLNDSSELPWNFSHTFEFTRYWEVTEKKQFAITLAAKFVKYS